MPTVYYVHIVREGADGAGLLDYLVIELQEVAEDGSFSKRVLARYHNKQMAIVHVEMSRKVRDEQPA